MVDTGDGKPVQIVCGAPNARAGLIGALAEPGTYVPGIDVTLSVGKIRGVESHGMMCSEKEFDMSDEHDGIIDLPEDAPVGKVVRRLCRPRRSGHRDQPDAEPPDCTGDLRHRPRSRCLRSRQAEGIPKAPDFAGHGETAQNVKVILDDESLCPGFAWRLVRGVKNGPSPKWMQQRLLAIGLRPINALVDVTNYMTFDQGRPMHVFDADKVKPAISWCAAPRTARKSWRSTPAPTSSTRKCA
jgi:phenylalanyl-tRNA synthetase beta chain